MSPYSRLLLATSSVFITGCMNLAPVYEQPEAPIPYELPAGASGTSLDNLIAWEMVFASPELRQLVEIALEENRDLRIAVANIEIARAQYGISQSSLLPTVTASGSAVEGGRFDTSGPNNSVFRDSAVLQIGITSYELDFFGRVQNLSESAFQSYMATLEGERASRIAIISTIAETYLRLATDRELYALALDTVDAQSESLNLTRELLDAGVATELDTRRASASVETARAQVAQYEAQIKQDLNALRLVLGASLPEGVETNATLLPSPVALDIPVGTNSDILLNRPDVIAAERQLIAANANIGAARAAMFPSISLTGRAGYSSSDLEDFFNNDVAGWTIGPSISLPIFDAGARQGRIEVSEAQKELAVAEYERAIQSAFRETSDALAVADTIETRISALEQLVEDTGVTLDLSRQRFQVGVDDYLSVLDAQRQSYTASQQLILARRDRALNAIATYRALGAAPEQPRDEIPATSDDF
ncbi:MAG: transporter [Ponticaulis sp.]|nr:transporter [Ponticaulis sp.]|tara:strand:+ start:16418 stop:17848 length:1431 start_codon:yes stop_codon:yes gene_type:complete